jgi:hypothetical protein
MRTATTRYTARMFRGRGMMNDSKCQVDNRSGLDSNLRPLNSSKFTFFSVFSLLFGKGHGCLLIHFAQTKNIYKNDWLPSREVLCGSNLWT